MCYCSNTYLTPNTSVVGGPFYQMVKETSGPSMDNDVGVTPLMQKVNETKKGDLKG